MSGPRLDTMDTTVSKVDTALTEWIKLPVREASGPGDRNLGPGLSFQGLWQGGRLKGSTACQDVISLPATKKATTVIPCIPINVISLHPCWKCLSHPLPPCGPPLNAAIK